MDNRYVYLVVFLMFLTFGLSGCFEPKATEYFNRDLEVSENTILTVSTINGQIEINLWDGDNISINAVKKSAFGEEELELTEINVIEGQNTVDIDVTYDGERTTTPSVDINIKVPESVSVKSATTSNGAIQISDTKGDVVATTSNGAIVIDNVDGFVSAITSNGRIEVTDTTGIKELKSSNMRIEAELFDFREDLRIATSNGAITVYINTELNADIEMSTSNGQITISDVVLNLSDDEEKHKLGMLGVGGKKIDIVTSNGNIYLRKLEI